MLEDAGRLERTHGGAIAPRVGGNRPEPAFEVRERLQRDEKWRIGAAAAVLVEDGESIVFDASTTALYMARHLRERPAWHQLTVVTNSIRIALELAGHPGITVLMLGGRVRSEALSVVGPLGDGVFRRVNVQKAFVGAVGLTLDAGLSATRWRRRPRSSARWSPPRARCTRWSTTPSSAAPRPRPSAGSDRLTGILTDEASPADMVGALRDLGVEVTQVARGER